MLLVVEMNEFFEWLAAHHDDEVIGQPGQCFHCPLARFLSAKAGLTVGIDEGRYGWAMVEASRWMLLPRWATLFLAVSERLFGSSLTAYEAVGLLARVESMLAPVLVASWGMR